MEKVWYMITLGHSSKINAITENKLKAFEYQRLLDISRYKGKYTYEESDTESIFYTIQQRHDMGCSVLTACDVPLLNESWYMPDGILYAILDNLPSYITFEYSRRDVISNDPSNVINLMEWNEHIQLLDNPLFEKLRNQELFKPMFRMMDTLRKYITLIAFREILYVKETDWVGWDDTFSVNDQSGALYWLTKYCDFPSPIEDISLDKILSVPYLVWLVYYKP